MVSQQDGKAASFRTRAGELRDRVKAMQGTSWLNQITAIGGVLHDALSLVCDMAEAAEDRATGEAE